MYKLIIFDFDDTIVDNSKLDYMGFKIPSKILNITCPTKLELYTYRKKGLLAKEIIQIFSNIDEQTLNNFLKLRKKFLLKESVKYLKIKPNSKSLFKKLEKSDINLIICSANNNGKMIKTFLIKNKLKSFFKFIFTMNDFQINLDNSYYSNRILIKTSLIRSTLKQNKIYKKDILYVGNSVEDYVAAKSLKIKFIYFSNPYLPNPKIVGLKKISNMKNLSKIIFEENK